jgi:uncharacterized membrane protein HdeD (DUF308 family)/3',5'-cyclic AMP phosphodiesterase CpdA
METVVAADRRPVVTSLGLVTVALGVAAVVTPLTRVESPSARVGWLLALAACIEGLHALRRSTAAGRREATVGAVISMAIALFLINAPFVAARALTILIAGWFALDALRNAVATFRGRTETDRRLRLLATLGNTAVAVLVLLAQGWLLKWVIAVAGALRIFGIAWNITVAAVYSTTEADESILAELGLAEQPAAAAVVSEVAASEHARAAADRGWTAAFMVTLLAIHAGRMNVDFTLLGLISPAVAVLGDMFIAVLITLLLLNPIQMAWHGPTRWIERRVWQWHLRSAGAGSRLWITRLTAAWLRFRLRLAIRLRETRYSIPAVLNLGLQRGLPVAAVIAATVPIWGMSWYFDTENWAAGMWNSWAESRTDTWRAAMVKAVLADQGGSAAPTTFAVTPAGVESGDFSFIVIGDTGEGDASQHVLRDQLLSVANTPDVKFVVISSDVVYPTGAMKDYEAKFWLPFKGVSRPVYAIPGNHDWYDALEAFAATFLQADAARRSIRARVETDLRLTSTTDNRIEDLVNDAARLRQAYGVPTGFQRAAFFEMQTDQFALLAIDTGVLRTIDPEQQEWLDAALERAAGRFTMAVLGHPFYAGGHDVAAGDEAFGRLKQQLRRRGVSIMMAGDTHDLEYYVEPGSSLTPPTHYFVNGGGGAYLSFGTSLAWPAPPATADWAHYPNLADVTRKIRDRTPWWKRPAWWWTDRFSAWPFSAEWLSAAFDYNVAPFFQSFVEVRIERSANRVRVIPYGVHGRLTWGDLAASDGLRASAGGDRTLVEWVMPLTPARNSP